MWDLLFLSVLVGFLFTYAPGFVMLRAFRVAPITSLACAPIVSIVSFSVLSILYERLGITCSWVTLVVPTLVVGLVLLAALSFVLGKTREGFSAEGSAVEARRGALRDWLVLALYALVGVVLVGWVFMRTFDSASSFVQEFDNVHHINTIRTFVDSGTWSSLTSTLYPVETTQFLAPFTGTGFYPSAWHVLASLLVDALGVPVGLAANAANALLIALVFPLSMFLLMRRLFADKPLAVFFGAFCALAFAAFPWKLLAWGPLYPNLAAFSLLPAVVALFIEALSPGGAKRERVRAGVLFAVGLVSLVFTHPNAVFTAGVFLAPFCVHRIASAKDPNTVGRRIPWFWKKTLACAAFIVGALALWVVLYDSPFLSSVVAYSWPSFTDVPGALSNVVFLGSRETVPQTVLGLLVLLGFAGMLLRRDLRWVAVSYALLCGLYVATASLDGPLKQLLTGFWYTDALRLSANMAVFAVPLAAYGLYGVWAGIRAALSYAIKASAAQTSLTAALAGCTALLFVGINFYPSYDMPDESPRTSAFGETKNFLRMAYGIEGVKLYSQDEMDFMQEVKNSVPADAVILNAPNDGTAFAYGIDDMNLYYRYLSGYGDDDERDESKAVRRSLDAVALDPDVAWAIQRIGAEYLVQLDQGGRSESNHFLFSYDEEDWFGIDRVNDDTPGFEVVLKRGDMRLYRIILPEEA